MDPTTVFCPNRNCPARGHTGQGNLGIHSRKEQRCICRECQKTFSATTGTVFSRRRPSAETVGLVVTVLAHGGPVQAIVAALGFDERTVADWWARASRQGQAVHESLVEQPRDLGQVQADELRVKQQHLENLRRNRYAPNVMCETNVLRSQGAQPCAPSKATFPQMRCRP
jgi:transposase-like protein